MAAHNNILGDLISTCFFSNEHFALYNHIEHIEISTIVDVVLVIVDAPKVIPKHRHVQTHHNCQTFSILAIVFVSLK